MIEYHSYFRNKHRKELRLLLEEIRKEAEHFEALERRQRLHKPEKKP
jgi:hypothetical protein